MSSIASSRSGAEGSRRINWGRVALVGLATVLVAVLINVAIYFIAGAFVQYRPEFEPLANVGAAIFVSVVFTAAAVAVYALVLRFSRNPVRTYVIIALVALVLTIIPDFVLVPMTPGSTDAQIAVLVLMHLIPAPVIIWMLTTLAGPSRVR